MQHWSPQGALLQWQTISQLFAAIMKHAVRYIASDHFRTRFDFVMEVLDCSLDDEQIPLQVTLEEEANPLYDNPRQARNQQNCRDREDGMKEVSQYLQRLSPKRINMSIDFLRLFPCFFLTEFTKKDNIMSSKSIPLNCNPNVKSRSLRTLVSGELGGIRLKSFQGTPGLNLIQCFLEGAARKSTGHLSVAPNDRPPRNDLGFEIYVFK
jgi:hypothetical protein